MFVQTLYNHQDKEVDYNLCFEDYQVMKVSIYTGGQKFGILTLISLSLKNK